MVETNSTSDLDEARTGMVIDISGETHNLTNFKSAHEASTC